MYPIVLCATRCESGELTSSCTHKVEYNLHSPTNALSISSGVLNDRNQSVFVTNMTLQIRERKRNVDGCSIGHNPKPHVPELTTVVQLFVFHSKDIPHTASHHFDRPKGEKQDIVTHNPLLQLMSPLQFPLRTIEEARSTAKSRQTRSPCDNNTAQGADASISPPLLSAAGSTFLAESSTAVPSLLADPSTTRSTCRWTGTRSSTACSTKSSLRSERGSI